MGRPAPMHRSCDERDRVQVVVRRGKANARTLTRARVLLKSDEGRTDAEIAEALDLSEQTIRNIRKRFGTGGVEAVLIDKRQERRRQALTDGQAAHLIVLTCSKVPDGHDHWTVRMLAGQAVELGYVRRISPETVRQLLKKRTEAVATCAVVHSQRRCRFSGSARESDLTYVVAIRSNHGVWLPPGEPRPVHQLTAV